MKRVSYGAVSRVHISKLLCDLYKEIKLQQAYTWFYKSNIFWCTLIFLFVCTQTFSLHSAESFIGKAADHILILRTGGHVPPKTCSQSAQWAMAHVRLTEY